MKPVQSFRTLFFATVVLSLLAAWPVLAQSHGDHQPERSRMLLIFAPDENNAQLTDQYKRLERDVGAMDSADVDVVYVIGDHMIKLPPPDSPQPADTLRKHYHIDATGFRVVLVGKDGWEKTRWSEPTDANKILNHAQDMPQPKSKSDTK